jgi:hypothetical protein
MVLARQTIDIPFGGLETKIDPQVVPVGKSLELENAQFGSIGAIQKRNGYTSLGTSKLGGGSVSTARGLLAHGEELLLVDKGNLYTRSSTASKWVNKGACWPTDIRTTPIGADDPSAHAGDPDVGISNGYALYAWDNGTPSACVVDLATGAYVISPTQVAASQVTVVRVVPAGRYIYIVIPQTTTVVAYYFDTQSPSTTFTGPVTLASDFLNGSYCLDAVVFDASQNRGVLAYESSGGGTQVTVLVFDQSGVVVGPTTVAENPDGNTNIGMGVCVSAAKDVYVAYKSSGATNLRCFALDSSLASKFAATTIESVAGLGWPMGIEETTNSILWVYTSTSTGAHTGLTYANTRKGTISSAGAVSGVGSVAMGCAQVSRPFLYNSQAFVVVIYDTETANDDQTHYFLLTTDGKPCGRILPYRANNRGASAGIAQPSSVVAKSPGVFVVGLEGRYSQNLLVDAQKVQLVSVEIDFTRPLSAAKLGGNLHIAGGQMYEYDGAVTYENGFHLHPDAVTESTSTAGGSLVDGTYQWTAVYAWWDTHGQIHFSSPASARTVTFSGGTNTNQFTMRVTNLRITMRSDVRILFYVTGVGVSVFYELSSAANSTTAHETQATYTTASGLTDNRQLYTGGGVLENDPPPPTQCIVSKGDRLYATTHDGKLLYTKAHVDGEAAQFVAETTQRTLNEDDGNWYALAKMDDALIVLSKSGLQALSGGGVTDTGAQDDLSQPRAIQSDTGILPGTLPASSEAGIYFKSSKGNCLLSRAGAVDYIGAPVEAYNSLTLASIVVLPEKNQVRFGHTDGSLVVLDYLTNQWSVFTNHYQVAAVAYANDYCFLQSTGAVYLQDSSFVDNIASVGLVATTPWIKLSGIQGFQRAYSASVLGTWKSAHTLTLKVYYDYNDTVAETDTINLSAGYLPGDPLQFNHHMGKKCQAVKFRIEDSLQAGTQESCTLTGISLELGGKGGLFKQPSTKTI